MPFLVRRIASGALWDFIRENLPPGLEALRIASGYGYLHLIYVKGDTPSLLSRLVIHKRGDPIAEIGHASIDVFHPCYLSTFDQLAQEFESRFNQPITIEYWESA